MTTLPRHQPCVCIYYVGDIVTAHVVLSSSSLAFDTKMSEKRKSTSPNAKQVKTE
jgi:hypothetical protein